MEWSARAGAALREPLPFEEPGRRRPERTHTILEGEIAGGLGSRVEGSLRFGLQETGDAEGAGGSDGPVAGDVELRVGWSPGRSLPGPAALAGWLLVKLPTGPEDGGASTDETDAGAGVSIGRKTGPVDFFGHAALLLLGNPLRNAAQDDVAGWGAGLDWRTGERWALTGEAEGRAFSRFGNSDARLRLGGRWIFGEGRLGAPRAGAVLWHGLTGDSATWGMEIVVSVAGAE